jgi:hypothetical protein
MKEMNGREQTEKFICIPEASKDLKHPHNLRSICVTGSHSTSTGAELVHAALRIGGLSGEEWAGG